MSDADYAHRHELVALRRRVAALEAIVQFSRRRENVDARLGPLLALIHAFAGTTAWTVGELLEDSRRSDRDLWWALDAIVGDEGNVPIKLGRWLQRHEGVAADGLRLERVARGKRQLVVSNRGVRGVGRLTPFAGYGWRRDDGPTYTVIITRNDTMYAATQHRFGAQPRHEQWDLGLSPREEARLQDEFKPALRALTSGGGVPAGLWNEIGNEARKRANLGRHRPTP